MFTYSSISDADSHTKHRNGQMVKKKTANDGALPAIRCQLVAPAATPNLPSTCWAAILSMHYNTYRVNVHLPITFRKAGYDSSMAEVIRVEAVESILNSRNSGVSNSSSSHGSSPSKQDRDTREDHLLPDKIVPSPCSSR